LVKKNKNQPVILLKTDKRRGETDDSWQKKSSKAWRAEVK